MPAGERALVNVAEDIKWKRKRGGKIMEAEKAWHKREK